MKVIMGWSALARRLAADGPGRRHLRRPSPGASAAGAG